ncbi:MAG: sulfotransferase domain-containing protein [Parvibaculum sp.]|uniref:sulfotransferase domain-containing protein n=1 Tax=Parvibaculum sp. TaxID=2024848 RepID=UPI001B1DA748|nr:sulfotransferase domain-containing protein [Parvibaculum sp.]MBO6635455.1 sulfotransferase domain-containing protein [Parvibaculum sp.]
MGALIWLASYPKSGNTWMRSFLHNLFRNSEQPVDINEISDFCLGESAAQWYRRHTDQPLNELTPEELAKLRPLVHRDFTTVFPDSVFVKTHNYLGESCGVPLHTMEVTAGGIYVLRNPLDVVISVSHHFGETIDEAIEHLSNEQYMAGNMDSHVFELHRSWSTHVKSWTENPSPQLLVVRYEDLLRKPRKYFKQVTSFLGLNPPPARLERAIRNSSFKALKAIEQKMGFKEKSKKADMFFREGRSEQWRDVLTPEQVRRIIGDHYEQMERFGYIPDDYRDAVPRKEDAV